MSRTEIMPDELHLVRDVMDKLLVDRMHEPIGRADGVVLVLNDEGQPRVSRIQVGSTVLVERISQKLGHLARRLGTRIGLRGGQPVRISFRKVCATGIEIVVDTSADRSATLAWERWLRRHLTRWIPSFKQR